MLTDDVSIRTLNLNWRGIDKPTNAAFRAAADGAGGPDDAPRMLASPSPMKPRAGRPMTSKAVDQHLSHLAVHGFCI
jgi:probable rRNA maturation factor